LFETASSLGGIIKSDNEKFKVGLNYISADRRIGKETDGRFVATISSKVNERLQLTEKWVCHFGINESAIVGDLEIQYRVNEDGTLNLRLIGRMILIILDKELAIPKELVLHMKWILIPLKN
jgi:hypothetical protein